MITLTLVRFGDMPAGMDPTPLVGDLLFVHARVLEELLRQGWTTIERLFRIPATLIQSGHQNRDLASLLLPGLGERGYLKRELATYRKDRLTAFVVPGCYTTKCVQEFVALRHLAKAGIRVAAPLALWLSRAGSRVQAALLLEELAGYTAFDLELARYGSHLTSNAEQLERVARALASFVAAVHNARVHDPDLFSWHLMVREGQLLSTALGPDDFALLDLQRASVLSWRPCCVRRARDIGAVLGTLDESIFPPRARDAFLAHYFALAQPKDPWRPLFPTVLRRRLARWRHRSKVRRRLALQREVANCQDAVAEIAAGTE